MSPDSNTGAPALDELIQQLKIRLRERDELMQRLKIMRYEQIVSRIAKDRARNVSGDAGRSFDSAETLGRTLASLQPVATHLDTPPLARSVLTAVVDVLSRSFSPFEFEALLALYEVNVQDPSADSEHAWDRLEETLFNAEASAHALKMALVKHIISLKAHADRLADLDLPATLGYDIPVLPSVITTDQT